jgi:4-hydroxy-3-methylbut-2-enyl diphosphate reductase
MKKEFTIPDFYQGNLVKKLKEDRKLEDPKKKDISPTELELPGIRIRLARHFGFCFGVENAISIAYRTVEENPGKRIFLLSEMIHNPLVNADLLSRGISFLMKTDGTRLVDFSTLNKDDIVIIPAFGTTLEIMKELEGLGLTLEKYNATCPFVEKVWKRSADLGKSDYTIIIHGKAKHEETRATFSHAKAGAHSLIVKDIEEAKYACSYILGQISKEDFLNKFANYISPGFNPETNLDRIGVVNQTTMLASETTEIADLFRQAMVNKYGAENLTDHFADTKDTLCYATNENQSAVLHLRDYPADFALVVGGYNSSNTSHLAELLEEKMPTYFISGPEELTKDSITHYDQHQNKIIQTADWLPIKQEITINITAGASCPDTVIDAVIEKVAQLRQTNHL